MASNTIRWAVAKHLVGLLQGEPLMAQVGVFAWWPGDNQVTAEMVWVDSIDGEVNVPTMKAGRKDRDDLFTIPFQVRVASQLASMDATQTRLSEIVGAIEDIPADWSTLDDFDGVVDAQITSERQTAAVTQEGCIAFAEVVMTVHARLS